MSERRPLAAILVLTLLSLGFAAPAAAQSGAALDSTAKSASRAPFQDCDGCPIMVPLPTGSFQMGSTAAEAEREGVPPYRSDAEIPAHTVTIGARVALGRFPVTRGEFARFVANTGYRAAGGCSTYDGDSHHWREVAALDWSDPGFPQSDADPVVCVSARDAEAYAAWLTAESGKPYRLPSEAEWEYGARAGTSSARYFPDDRTQFCRFANGADRAYDARHASLLEAFPNNLVCDDGYAYTAPVGSFVPNAFALFDMLGNVNQITADDWHKGYAGAPVDGGAWIADRGTTVLRGGSWYVAPGALRAARRIGVPRDKRFSDTGFRVARTLSFVGL